jgi:hypothetical protein
MAQNKSMKEQLEGIAISVAPIVSKPKRKKKLKGGQAKLDANKDGKISGEDFKMLRDKKEKGGKVKKDVMDLKYAYQEGGDVDSQMTVMMTKPMKSDEQMEDDFIDFVVTNALDNTEQKKLMDTLESDEEISVIFDKLMSTATEFAGSGPVEGPGSAVSDSIPARLSDGEFVITAKATEEIGADNLQRMMDDAEAKADDRQNMQEGGEAEEEKDTYGRPIMESDKDEEIKKAMLGVNPRLA